VSISQWNLVNTKLSIWESWPRNCCLCSFRAKWILVGNLKSLVYKKNSFIWEELTFLNWKRVFVELIKELVVSNLLLKGLDILAEPRFINKLIVSLVEKHNEHSDSLPLSTKDSTAHQSSSVELLKHWCSMNGSIFKTVRSVFFMFSIIKSSESNIILFVIAD